MKKAIVTLTYGDYFERMAVLTHPTIKAYANKIRADFIKWSDTSGYAIPEYKKMEISQLLNDYDRVLFLDTDIIIRADAPDIFDVVPEDRMGMLEEGQYWDRRGGMYGFMVKVRVDPAAWDGKYYNSGVIVSSKCHRDVFVRPLVEHDHFREQTWLNTKICEQKTRMFPLPYRFNRIADADPFYGETRLDSWFLHYAGMQFRMGHEQILEVIEHDLTVWRQVGPRHRYQLNIGIIVEGGLGDQVAAEPALRYAREVFYPIDNLVAVSRWPEIFRHLNLPVHHRHEDIPYFAHYRKRFTRAESGLRDYLARHQIHGTSLASLMALGVELPAEYKTPRLPVQQQALVSVTEKVRPAEPGRLVLLHPGRGVPPKTFPPDVWQSYADALIQNGYAVAVIGKRMSDEKGVVDFDRSKCVDLVDRLSVEELIALISLARVTISNDSAPIQIAGAFDRWIGLIATLRHPQYVLPWRNGSQFYRAANLERLPMYYEYFQRPSGGEPPRLDVCNQSRLRECLPEPKAILAFVSSAFAEA
jgi:Glycosyltransferase family 9 (heptosyltransferase)